LIASLVLFGAGGDLACGFLLPALAVLLPITCACGSDGERERKRVGGSAGTLEPARRLAADHRAPACS
jgi:hypothetical protein